MENKLEEMYKLAAQKAFEDDIDPGNETQLNQWIWDNCKFPIECMFYLVLGIGSELADIRAREKGYTNQTDQIWQERIEPNWKCDQFGKWSRK